MLNSCNETGHSCCRHEEGNGINLGQHGVNSHSSPLQSYTSHGPTGRCNGNCASTSRGRVRPRDSSCDRPRDELVRRKDTGYSSCQSGCTNQAHATTIESSHSIPIPPISISNSLTPEHFTKVIHQNGQLSERCRVLESELSTARSRITQLEGLLFGKEKDRDTVDTTGMNGPDKAIFAIEGIQGVRSDSKQDIMEGWARLMASNHAGLLKLLGLAPSRFGTLGKMITDHPTLIAQNIVEAIHPSAPIDLPLIYSLLSTSLGHDSNALNILTLHDKDSQIILDQSSTLVAMSLCGSLPGWTDPVLVERSLSSGFTLPHSKVCILDRTLFECQPAVVSAEPPRMDPEFWFDAQDRLDIRWKSWGKVDEVASLDIEKVLVIAGPITIGKERIAAFHISTDTRRVTVFDTVRWNSRAVKLVFGSIISVLLVRDYKQSHPGDAVLATSELLSEWQFISRQLALPPNAAPIEQGIEDPTPSAANFAITYAILSAIASSPEPLEDVEASMLDIKFDTAGRKCIDESSIYEKHSAMLNRINLEGHLVCEIIKGIRK